MSFRDDDAYPELPGNEEEILDWFSGASYLDTNLDSGWAPNRPGIDPYLWNGADSALTFTDLGFDQSFGYSRGQIVMYATERDDLVVTAVSREIDVHDARRLVRRLREFIRQAESMFDDDPDYIGDPHSDYTD